MREGYYSIINGYKEPFLEPVVTKDDLSDRYKGGTSFDDIFALFTFDRSLRALTFRNLIKAEATARTAIAYTFRQNRYCIYVRLCSSGARCVSTSRELLLGAGIPRIQQEQ